MLSSLLFFHLFVILLILLLEFWVIEICSAAICCNIVFVDIICWSYLYQLKSTLWAVGVNLCPLNQTNLVIEVPASRIHKMIIIEMFIEAYRASVVFLLCFLYVFELIVLVWRFWCLRNGVRIDVGFYNHHLVQLPFSLLKNSLFGLETSYGE